MCERRLRGGTERGRQKREKERGEGGFRDSYGGEHWRGSESHQEQTV